MLATPFEHGLLTKTPNLYIAFIRDGRDIAPNRIESIYHLHPV